MVNAIQNLPSHAIFYASRDFVPNFSRKPMAVKTAAPSSSAHSCKTVRNTNGTERCLYEAWIFAQKKSEKLLGLTQRLSHPL
jgi:hypothetical protein